MSRIFIVEDDENIVELLGDELRAWGYETMSVKDFNNVAEEVEEFKSDLVLMDITLPYYNGFYSENQTKLKYTDYFHLFTQ